MATKTLVTTFRDVHEAEAAVHALHEAGFARDDLGWVTRTNQEHTLAVGSAAGILIGLSAVFVPGVGAVLVAGPLVSALGGAAVGAAAGGLVDALVNVGVPTEEALHYAERLRRGGALVTVTVDDEEEEARALDILKIETGHPVPVHIPERISSISLV